MVSRFLIVIMMFHLSGMIVAEDMKLPVFYLKYDASLGSEETEEEQVEESSHRHTVSLRIKEEFSDVLTGNLLNAYSRKLYLLETGSYWYYYINPYVTWDLTDQIAWDNGFRSKWVRFDELDAKGFKKDYTSLLYQTSLTYSPISPLKITPSFKGIFDLYQNEEKSKQTYTFGVAINSRIESFTIASRYKIITRFPLAETSQVSSRLTNEFGASLTWDPNQ